jgi:hypothetical protein
MLQPLDGPSKQYTLTVDNTAVKEIISGSPLEERKVITIQAEGRIRIYFGDGENTPNITTVLDDGLIHFKWGKESYEASTAQAVFIAGETATLVKVYIVERA